MFFDAGALFSFVFQCLFDCGDRFPLLFNVVLRVGLFFFFNIFLGLLIVGHSFPLFFNLSYDVHIGIWVIEKHHFDLWNGRAHTSILGIV